MRTTKSLSLSTLVHRFVDLVDGFALRLGHVLPREGDEEGEKSGEHKEGVLTEQIVQWKEEGGDEEVGQPIGHYRDGIGITARRRREDFADEEPGNGARSRSERNDEQ